MNLLLLIAPELRLAPLHALHDTSKERHFLSSAISKFNVTLDHSVHLRTVSDTIEHKIHTFSTTNTGTKTRYEKLIMVVK